MLFESEGIGIAAKVITILSLIILESCIGYLREILTVVLKSSTFV